MWFPKARRRRAASRRRCAPSSRSACPSSWCRRISLPWLRFPSPATARSTARPCRPPAGGDAPAPADDDLPRTETERTLAAIWAKLLKRERIGVGEDVFDLGAHSLLAMRALSQIRDAFDVHVPTRNLFEHPTVAGLAGVIDRLTFLEASNGGGGGDGAREEIRL